MSARRRWSTTTTIHHKAYVDNGNKLIAGTEWEGKSLEEIVKGTYDKPTPWPRTGIFNNASQHWNHAQFWEMMGPGERRHADRAGKAAHQVESPSAPSTSLQRESSPPPAPVSSAPAGRGWSRTPMVASK
ncbi:MAG: hypothetical protein EpisKO_09510 [Epibacterium sp.]